MIDWKSPKAKKFLRGMTLVGVALGVFGVVAFPILGLFHVYDFPFKDGEEVYVFWEVELEDIPADFSPIESDFMRIEVLDDGFICLHRPTEGCIDGLPNRSEYGYWYIRASNGTNYWLASACRITPELVSCLD